MHISVILPKDHANRKNDVRKESGKKKHVSSSTKSLPNARQTVNNMDDSSQNTKSTSNASLREQNKVNVGFKEAVSSQVSQKVNSQNKNSYDARDSSLAEVATFPGLLKETIPKDTHDKDNYDSRDSTFANAKNTDTPYIKSQKEKIVNNAKNSYDARDSSLPTNQNLDASATSLEKENVTDHIQNRNAYDSRESSPLSKQNVDALISSSQTESISKKGQNIYDSRDPNLPSNIENGETQYPVLQKETILKDTQNKNNYDSRDSTPENVENVVAPQPSVPQKKALPMDLKNKNLYDSRDSTSNLTTAKYLLQSNKTVVDTLNVSKDEPSKTFYTQKEGDSPRNINIPNHNIYVSNAAPLQYQSRIKEESSDSKPYLSEEDNSKIITVRKNEKKYSFQNSSKLIKDDAMQNNSALARQQNPITSVTPYKDTNITSANSVQFKDQTLGDSLQNSTEITSGSLQKSNAKLGDTDDASGNSLENLNSAPVGDSLQNTNTDATPVSETNLSGSGESSKKDPWMSRALSNLLRYV